MSVFDTRKNALGGRLDQAAIEAMPPIVVWMLLGRRQGLPSQIRNSGDAAQVNCGLGRGANEPITTEDLRKFMNRFQLRQIARKLGVPADTVLVFLARGLPAAVDRHGPDGTLAAPQS